MKTKNIKVVYTYRHYQSGGTLHVVADKGMPDIMHAGSKAGSPVRNADIPEETAERFFYGRLCVTLFLFCIEERHIFRGIPVDIPDVPEAPAGERVGHRHDALPVILAMQDMKDAAVCVNILQAQRQCFGNAQPAAIQHPEQQWMVSPCRAFRGMACPFSEQ